MTKLELLQKINSSMSVAEVMVELVLDKHTTEEVAKELEKEIPDELLKKIIVEIQDLFVGVGGSGKE